LPLQETFRVRACVIFNPAAKGRKAERFRRCLDTIAAECTLKRTSRPGEARQLAAAAVGEDFDTVIAAGGDGTISEVLNGLGDVPDGFERVRFGVLPLGTVNVFARELKIPTQPEPAWEILRKAREMRIDVGCVEFRDNGEVRQLHFVQMAGAGLDARAIERVSFSLKKKVGPLAYVIAGLQALLEKPARIVVSDGKESLTGALVLVGNGRLYGGDFQVFPDAALRDGVLEVCVFPRANWQTLLQCGPKLLLQKKLPPAAVRRLRASSFTLTSEAPTAFEVEGELAGQLPAKFFVKPAALRVLVP
jgi:diacylglycerol kinase (ATP)